MAVSHNIGMVSGPKMNVWWCYFFLTFTYIRVDDPIWLTFMKGMLETTDH